MRTLLLLRHAKSSWAHEELADHDRPLNKRGRRDAPEVGRRLRDRDLLPELILCSTAERARQTTELLVEAAAYEGEVRYLPDMYHASPRDMTEVLHTLDDELASIMLVGHNPGMEQLIERLTGNLETMPTAALAHVELPITHWRDASLQGRGRLVGITRPRGES